MKRILSLSLILALGMTGFAQTKSQVVKAPVKKVGTANVYKSAMGKDVAAEAIQFTQNPAIPSSQYRYGSLEEFETMTTNYDLQSNGYVANRMARFEDGSVGVVATWSVNTPSFPDRGTGYNFYDGSSFGDQPSARVEMEKTGWPAYAQYGPDGEIVVAHTGTNLVFYTREHKGQGEWVRGEIPNPNVGSPAQEMTWPRVVTSGPDHSIIHALGCDQDANALANSYVYYCRSTDGGNTWDVNYLPAIDESEHTCWGSDYYAMAANGNTVAILLTGDIMANTYVLKSQDNGETWEKILVWDNPYAGLDWENDPASLFGEDNVMYGPSTGALCIDNDGMVHVALNAFEYYHGELGTSYNFYYGFGVDGIFYWNEEMYDGGPFQDMGWTCPEDGAVIEPNQHNALRMWWPTSGSGDYITRNFEKPLIGFVNPEYTSTWDNNMYYYNDYYSYFMGCSALPAICVDESGTVAIAYSCPDPSREPSGTNNYYRAVFVSYVEAPYTIGDYYQEWTEEKGCFLYNEDYLQGDFMHMMEECVALSSIQNTTDLEFWVSYQGDELCGFAVGNTATQGDYTDNIVWAMKVVPNYEGAGIEEAVNPLTNVRVYPNPVQDVLNIEVNASQASEMSIAIYNITGQKVMETSTTISTGINAPAVNVSNLNSGIYFATVKANGFENTVKFIVK